MHFPSIIQTYTSQPSLNIHFSVIDADVFERGVQQAWEGEELEKKVAKSELYMNAWITNQVSLLSTVQRDQLYVQAQKEFAFWPPSMAPMQRPNYHTWVCPERDENIEGYVNEGTVLVIEDWTTCEGWKWYSKGI